MKIFYNIAFSIVISTNLFALGIGEHWTSIETKTKAENWAEALPLIEAAIAEYPEESNFRITEAWVLRNLKRNQDSIAKVRQTLQKWPTSNQLQEQLSYSLCAYFDELYQKAGYDRSKMPAEYIKIAEEAYTSFEHAWSSTIYGVSLRLQQKYVKAINHLVKALKKYPGNKYINDTLAYVYLDLADELLNQKNNPQKAVKYAIKGNTLLPNLEWSCLILAYSYQRFDVEKAIPYFQKCAKINSANKDTVNNLGYSYQLLARQYLDKKQKAKVDQLLKTIKIHLDGSPDQSMPFIRVWEVIVSTTEDFDPLISYLKKMAKKYPNDIDLLITCGSVLNKLQYKQRRTNAKLADETSKESNRWLRDGMLRFEALQPNRPRYVNLHFPLKGKVIIAAGFDAGGTHSGYGKYSYDLMTVDENASTIRPNTQGKANNDYYAFGVDIMAVDDGIVESVSNQYADGSNPGIVTFGPGNHLVLLHANGLRSFYDHIKSATILVKKGDRVSRGQVLAKVGNSGMSHAPHLHLTIVTPDWVSTYFDFGKLRALTNNEEKEIAGSIEQGLIILK